MEVYDHKTEDQERTVCSSCLDVEIHKTHHLNHEDLYSKHKVHIKIISQNLSWFIWVKYQIFQNTDPISALKVTSYTNFRLLSWFLIISFGVTTDRMTDSREGVSQDKVQYKNILLTNNRLGLFSLTGAVIVLCSVGCEIGKQISNYSINYYNGGSYPLPQTVMVTQIPPSHPSPSLPRWSWWSSSSWQRPSWGQAADCQY